MNSSLQPLVSCIMPTFNRRKFVPFAVKYFLRQNYPNKELIVIDDGTDSIEDLIPDESSIQYYRLNKKITLGEKLNLACEYAKGEIIAHWDDDDWYAPTRISYQIHELQNNEADVCGINNLLYLNLSTKNAYQYIYPSDQRPWLIGSSLCYSKAIWKQNHFAPINVGMDALFVWTSPSHRVQNLANKEISVHMIHEDNVSPKKTGGIWWHSYPLEEIQNIMQEDWQSYSNGAFHSPAIAVKGKAIEASSLPMPTAQSLLKNVYACAVHESEDCVIDMVRNLHFHDPDSRIILYNGGLDQNLLNKGFPYEDLGCEIFPNPVPLQHGYLHNYALNSMKFALQQASFDTFTIVDSDQLAIRDGYTNHISDYLKSRTTIGLLSNKPEKISVNDTGVWTAIQAFNELELWKPLLKQFHDGEEKFVHWSFWPSTVFTVDAVKDLLKLFDQNVQLQQIMKKTKIWATEEIVLPTLIRLLGYDIGLNPCANDFVSYRKDYSLHDLENAENKTDAFWIHPIQRKYDDPLRKQTRQKSNHYIPKGMELLKETKTVDLPLMLPLLENISKIEGWLADKEADLLIASTLKACCSLHPPHIIVEIGSYHGKSTVAIGTVIKALFPSAKVFAIDPHEGIVGATDQGLQKVAPTLEKFNQNIHEAGLEETVILIKDYSFNIDWKDPISFLFIDGLHDYPNVARDFWKYSPHVLSGGFIAFHDYADYYPGVMALVDEVLLSGNFRKICLAESLMVIQKVN
ncbi:glycosyltransferase [Algoriphagus antarcticus]|nr:glycosyltransferase [Algoriphagus antarcticus]